MYLKLHPILKTQFSRHLKKFEYIIYRSKSDLISPHCFSYKELQKALPILLSKLSVENFIHGNVIDRVSKITECSSNEDNLFRGSLALLTYETLEKSENITGELANQMRSLAWCIEMVHSYFVILDDMDKAPGASHWCNYDPVLLRGFIDELLRIELADKPFYSDIVQLFNKAFLNTSVGHHLDIMNRKMCNNFTTETYNTIADLKTSFHTFQFPVSVATKMLREVDNHQCKQMQSICLDLGRLYHMQTDYLDCYGEELDESGIPTHSYDIQLGKCSWLAVSALQRCTPAQRIVFNACYGSKDPAHIERVKLLYDQLQMPQVYRAEKRKMCDNIAKEADKGKLTYDTLFLNILNVIEERDNVQ